MAAPTAAEAAPADMQRDVEGAPDEHASARGGASGGDAVKAEGGGKHGERAVQPDDMDVDGGDAAGAADVKQEAGANGSDAAGAAGTSPTTAGRPEAPKETMEEAAARRRIEANILRRAAAIREAQAKATLAAETPPYELPRARCHWDFVLAEMAWMAVDFAGERIWKLNAAAQLAAGTASVVAKGALKAKMLSEEDMRKIVAARAAACVTEFWVRMKQRAAEDAAPDAPPPVAASRGVAALEVWAVQLLRERVAAAAAGAQPRQGDDDAMPFSGKQAPSGLDAPHTPLLWGEAPLWGLTYPSEENASELLAHAAAAETAAIAACEERMRAWEENERNRQRAVAEMARLVREEEEQKTAIMKQQAAAAAAAATAAAAMPGGGYAGGHLAHGGYGAAEWDERRRKKSKKGMYGYEEDDMGGANVLPPFGSIGGYAPAGTAGIPSKRMRTSAAAASAARAAAVAGDVGMPGRYGYMPGGYAMPVQGQGGMMPPGKRRKGDEMGGEDPRRMRQGDAGDRRGGGRKGRPQGQQISIVAMPWSPAEDALLQAIVREFCRPRPNWALVSDVLAQGAPFRGVFRRPDHCRLHWDQLSRAQAASAAAQAGMLPPPADGEAPHVVEAEPREDDAARSKRRAVLTNLLPIEQELLKIHLEQLVAVAARYRARRGAEGSEVPARRNQPHSSWLLLGSEPLRSPAELADAPPPPPMVPSAPGMTPGMTPGAGDSRGWTGSGGQGMNMGGPTPAAIAAAQAAAALRRPSQHSPPGPTALMAPPPRASGKPSKSRGRSGSRADGRR